MVYQTVFNYGAPQHAKQPAAIQRQGESALKLDQMDICHTFTCHNAYIHTKFHIYRFTLYCYIFILFFASLLPLLPIN